MRTENFITLFITLSFAIYALFCWHTNLLSAQTKENTKTESILIASNQAALSAVEERNSAGAIFQKSSVRETAIEKFKDNFNRAMNYNGSNETLVDYYVPCIFLVDDDGYYVVYTTTAIGSNNAQYMQNVITEINTWTRTYGDYTVRYHLSNTVEIYKGNQQYSGVYGEAYAHFSTPSQLNFMQDYSTFIEEKDNVICSIMQNQINYYISTHNDYANTYDKTYTFTMPQITDFNARLMDAPSIISFAQGIQYSTTKGYINVYALTGAIEDELKMYYEVELNGNLYYHEEGCTHVTATEGKKKSAASCARDGYSPCPYCVR